MEKQGGTVQDCAVFPVRILICLLNGAGLLRETSSESRKGGRARKTQVTVLKALCFSSELRKPLYKNCTTTT